MPSTKNSDKVILCLLLLHKETLRLAIAGIKLETVSLILCNRDGSHNKCGKRLLRHDDDIFIFARMLMSQLGANTRLLMQNSLQVDLGLATEWSSI